MPMQFLPSMKSFRLLLLAALAVVACGKNTAQLTGVVADAPESGIVLKMLDVSRFQTVDTLKTNAAGEFSCKVEVAEPSFFYLFYGDRQIASLLLQQGDKVKVETDTLGAYKTSGSEECLKLQKVENAYNAFMRDLAAILRSGSASDAALSRRYVEYYRDRVNYVMQNSHSLASVPVFFQQINEDLPVFSSNTDGLIMNAVADSLSVVYPESRWVKALRKEGDRRLNMVKLANQISQAPEIGYFDIDLPGMEGKNIKLSDVEAPVTMVYFWASTAEQKMFNISSLLPLYEEFHGKGLEIYSVCLDADKTTWATAVRNQKLPWVNVCDTRGAYSPYVNTYGVTTLPMVWVIKNGVVDTASGIKDAATMRAYLKKNL